MVPAAQEQHEAYRTHQKKVETDRDIEARALLICANRLDVARNASDNREVYIDAIRLNQKLWTMFQVSLCDPANPLPAPLKNTLLNLSCFVDKISFQAMREFKPGLLQSLIDINRSIATGLNKKPAGSAAPDMAAITPAQATPVMTSV